MDLKYQDRTMMCLPNLCRSLQLIACIGFISISTFAQTARFKNFGNQESFMAPGGHRSFSQDSLGFLWIGTGGGLYRFDGYDFKVYKRNPEDSLSLFQEGANLMHVDPIGRLWLLYGDRLQRYDMDLDGFVTYKPDVGGKLIRSLSFMGEEGIWIGSTGMGLFYFDLKTHKTTNFANENADLAISHERNYIYDIQQHGSVLLLGTQDGLWKFDIDTKSFTQPKWSKADSIIFADPEGNWVNGIFEHSDHYWLSSASGLIKLDTNFAIVKSLNVQKTLQRFDNSMTNFIDYGVAQDQKDIFWISSRGLGLVRYDPHTDELTNFRHNPSDINSLASDHLVGVFVDRSQNVWLGSFDKGISQLKKDRIKVYNYLPGVPVSGLTIVPGTEEDNLYIPTLGKGLWTSRIGLASLNTMHFQPISLNSKVAGFDNLMSIHLGKDWIWLASVHDGVMGLSFDKQTGLLQKNTTLLFQAEYDPLTDAHNPHTITDDQTTELREDTQGDLWIGTMGFGLSKVNLQQPYGKAGSVESFVHDDQDSTSMINPGWISGLWTEDDGSVWVSTYGGLELYRNGHFEHIYKNVEGTFLTKTTDGSILFGTKRGLYEGTKESGQYVFRKVDLPDDPFIWTALEDETKRLWISTGQGLFCLDRKQQIILQFNDQDGIIGDRRGVLSHDGIMAFSGPEGISIFNPKSVRADNSKVRPIITNLKVNNKSILSGTQKPGEAEFAISQSIHTAHELTLDHTQNIFSLEFASMELTYPEKNKYAYMLEGFNTDWVQTDWKNRTATYTNLSAGDYVFKLKASNHDGVWSDQETTLKVKILPPPWRTWWAYGAYGLIFLGLLYWARSNITQRERLKANLKLEHLELKKAQEVDKIKTSFFTNISHEFRTPLTLIKGPVQNIIDQFISNQEEIDKKKIIDQLKLVQRNSDHLLKLINQLLDLAKLESGILKIEKSEGDLFLFIRALASSFESFARQKNVSIEINVPPNSMPALFDKDKFETILINLVNNAVKFTPSDGRISVRADAQHDSKLILSVKDTGIGIPEEQQHKIFERFHQVSDAHKEVGTGIGLSLVKELVALMEGTISVKSTPGEGSEFLVVLPFEKSMRYKPETTGGLDVKIEITSSYNTNAFSNEQPVVSGQKEDDQKKPHVLIVEDNADLRQFIIDSLGKEFYFLEAENGKIGLDVATKEIPDLIISDVMMPEMDGITMVTRIKKDIHTSHIPIILLTAKSSVDSKLSGLQSGADDYLTKPFNKNELLLKVRNGVNRQVKLREKLRAELMSTAPKVEVLSEDEQFLNSVKEKILERLSDEQLSVESLADDMGMSRVQLYRKVSGLTDISVNELIRKLRLQRAAQLLRQKWGPVSQVAYEVGFSNLSYFSKVFKEEFGVLPSEFGGHSTQKEV